MLSFRLTFEAFGLSTVAFHLGNIIFHAFVSVLVTLVARFLTQGPLAVSVKVRLSAPVTLSERFLFILCQNAELFTLIAGLLFAVHPIHVEAVTSPSSLPRSSLVFSDLIRVC